MSKSLWLGSACVALALVLPLAAPSPVRAQDVGDEEKKDEPKPDAPKPDEPKPDEPKPDAPKPDAPKPDAPKPEAKKSVVFDKAPDSWKGDQKPRGMMKGLYKIPGADGADEAFVIMVFVGKGDFDKELDRWISHAEDKDGKKLDKSAVKQDSFDANGIKVRTAEFSGTLPAQGPRKKGEAPEKKAGQKALAAYLEGPDGAWVVRIQGGEKTVDKARDDFLKFVKSARPGERPPEEERPRKRKKGEE